MNLMISLALAALVIVVLNKPLKRAPVLFYIAAVVIAAVFAGIAISGVRLPEFVNTWIVPVFAQGGLAGALFIAVMITGALPNGSKAMKLLMPVRAQLSIIACILTLGHNIAYGKTYFVRLFCDAAALPANQLIAAVCSIAMILLMLPLFVTSFQRVRKKMSPLKWKQLQKTAYLFYFLLFCHIMLLSVPLAVADRSGYRLSVCIYFAIFLSYFVCRVEKARLRKKKGPKRLVQIQTVTVLICVLLATTGFVLSYRNAANATKKTAEHLAEPTTSFVSTNVAEDETAGETEATAQYHDGSFSGSGMGNNGMITVSITIENDTITSVIVDSQKEDPEYFADAVGVIDRILEANGTHVDAVSGATYSSYGILDAVDAALELAKIG